MMNNILQDPSPSALKQVIEANTIESFKTWGKWAKLELQQDPEIAWTASDIRFFLFNAVLGLVPQSGITAAESLKTVVTATSPARTRKLPIGGWA